MCRKLSPWCNDDRCSMDLISGAQVKIHWVLLWGHILERDCEAAVFLSLTYLVIYCSCAPTYASTMMTSVIRPSIGDKSTGLTDLRLLASKIMNSFLYKVSLPTAFHYSNEKWTNNYDQKIVKITYPNLRSICTFKMLYLRSSP